MVTAYVKITGKDIPPEGVYAALDALVADHWRGLTERDGYCVEEIVYEAIPLGALVMTLTVGEAAAK